MKLEIALEYGFLIRVTTNRKVDFRPVDSESRFRIQNLTGRDKGQNISLSIIAESDLIL